MTDDDMSDTLAPNSQQLDAVDLIGGARTFTVERVTKTGGEQPLNVYLAEFDRPWRPGRNMRRVLGNVWGTKFGPWTGRRITLYCDPSVVYASKAVGGIRVTHMSHIDKRTPTPIIPTQGRGAIYNVDPLREPDQPQAATESTEPTAEEVAACDDLSALKAMWKRSGPERRAQIEQRVADLNAEPEPKEDES